MAVSVTVEGSELLKRKLARIASAFVGPAVQRVSLAGAQVQTKAVQKNIVERGLVDTGNMLQETQTVAAGQFSAATVVNVPYAAAHEYGLRNQIITDRQRAFFWAKWSATGDSMWKALALSTTYTIPARPYFRPAIAESKRAVTIAMANESLAILKETITGG